MSQGSPLAHLDRKGPLERVLSLFTDVRAGEGLSALLLATNVFYLLAFYQVLKIVRDALILSESGAVAASYASAGMALVLLVFVPLYGAVASRVNRVWLISGVTLFFASHLLIFYALGSAGVSIGIAFYIWIGVFNMVAVAQFWAFANDLYTNERGKRLFPLVGIGASLGALVGAGLTSYFFQGIGPFSLMLVAAFGLTVPVALTIVVHRREGTRPDAKKEEADKPVGGPGGFALVFKERYLLLIAMLVLVYNLVNTLGGFMLNTLIASEAASRIAAGTAGGATRAEIIGTLSGTVQTLVNLLSLLLQAFVVSRLFKFVGVRGALFILPVIAIMGYSAIAILPVPDGRAVGQDLREQHRLLDTEHHPSGALPSNESRGQVQGEAGDRFLLRAFWRHAAGWRGLRGCSTGPERSLVCHRQHRARGNLVPDRPRHPSGTSEIDGIRDDRPSRVVPAPFGPHQTPAQALVRSGDVLRFRYITVTS